MPAVMTGYFSKEPPVTFHFIFFEISASLFPMLRPPEEAFFAQTHHRVGPTWMGGDEGVRVDEGVEGDEVGVCNEGVVCGMRA